MPLAEQISQLRIDFLKDLCAASSAQDVEQLKTKYLGKKGPLQALMLSLRDCHQDERPELGKMINALKEELAAHCQSSLARLQEEELQLRLIQEKIDPTLPGRPSFFGREHLITQVLERITSILVGMGFSVKLGSEIDTDYYNFEALNFPQDHPARDMQDTFYLQGLGSWLLRTHTSNVQIRAMETLSPPIRIVTPGRCFRNETVSARSHVFFHQIEGMYIDVNVTFADLLATLEQFFSLLWGEPIATRFRPSYFPFVEPGVEGDIRCVSCRGKGCRLCKHTGWLEVCGAGMIHPFVLEKGNINPEKFSGYAWGMGIERMAMLLYGVTDIRLFTQNDMRFLSQF